MDSQVVNLKFLVTGAAGLIGNQLTKDSSKSKEVFSCYNQSKPEFGIPMNMDLQNHEMISRNNDKMSWNQVFLNITFLKIS